MTKIGIIALVVVLIGIRLLMPPVPGLVREFARRHGKWKAIALSIIALAGGLTVALLSRR